MLWLIACASVLGFIICCIRTVQEYRREIRLNGGRKTREDKKKEKEDREYALKHNLVTYWGIEDSHQYKIMAFSALVIFFISVCAWNIISTMLSAKTYEETFQTDTCELELLENSIKMEGYHPNKTCYVYGAKDNNDRYVYYYKSNGINDKVSSKNTIINEKTEDCIPMLIESRTYTKNKMKLAGLFSILTGQFEMVAGEKISYEIILPKGTINIQE